MNNRIKSVLANNYDLVASAVSGAVVCLAIGVVAATSAHKARRGAAPHAVRLVSNDNGTANVHLWSSAGFHDEFIAVPIVQD